MSEAGYPTGPLGSLIASQTGGGTPSRQNPAFWTGPIPWASVKDFAEGETELLATEERISQQGLQASATNLIPANTPIVCTRMAVGRVAIAPMDVAINQDLKALTPARGVSTRYLLRLADYAKPKAEAVSVGSTVKGIKVSDYLNIQLPLAPLPAQPKIAEVLDTLDAAIRGTEAVVAKLRAMKQGLLHDLLTRGIDANGDLRPPQPEAPHLYHQTPLGWLPKEWELAPLSTVIASLDAGVSVNAEDRPHAAGEIGVLKTSCVSCGEFFPNENKAVWDSERRRVLEPVLGDTIIVSRMNTPALVGETGYIDAPHETLFLPDRLWQIKARQGSKLVMRWLSYVFQHRAYRLHVETYATGTSGTMKNLPKKAFLSMLLGFPGVKEQLAVMNMLLSLDQRISAEKALLNKLRRQKSGLMDDLLTGRVPFTPLL